MLYIPRMEYARLETALLKDVTDDYYYGCSCQSCRRTARLSLSKLRYHQGPAFPLRTIRHRLTTPSRRRTTLAVDPGTLMVIPGHSLSENYKI